MIVRIEVATTDRSEMVDITSRIGEEVRGAGVDEGVCRIFVPHTTAAVTINENADPAVAKDMIEMLNRMVPIRQPFYTHAEGNSDAHVKSSLVGASETVMISGGRLVLGTWQGIYLCEFDGPRSRGVVIQISEA